ncbi:MAG: Ig-like domain-containing protein [Clostridiales Family XIII bacterium]|nr:Ig-like domain-containing protein [Clostridiales Family XIII bacterium]
MNNHIIRLSSRARAIAVITAAIMLITLLPFNALTAEAATGTKLAANGVTAERTEKEVFTLYNASVKSYSTSGLFSVKPVLKTSGYDAGTLSADAVSKTLQQINYFRALAGISSDITAYTSRMDRGQYGATGLEITGALTHSFTSDQQATLLTYMDSDQLAKAKDGIGAGVLTNPVIELWNGNCSSTNNVVESIKGYVDDTNNVGSGVGHRFNMFSLIGHTATFGAGLNSFSCVSVYGFNNTANNQDYYAWPCEGYFPKQAIADGALWSVQLSDKYLDSLNDLGVQVTYGGKTYDASVIQREKLDNADYPAIAFKLPDTVESAIASASTVYSGAGTAEVKVKITGINGSDYAEYTTKLFKELPVPLTGIAIAQAAASVNVGGTKQLSVTYTPSNTTDSKAVTWSSSDALVAKVSATGLVTGVAPGSATITAKCGLRDATYSITVNKPDAGTVKKPGSDTVNKPTAGTVSKPAAVSVKSLKKAGAKKIKVTWAANSKYSGYQVLIAKDKKFKKGKKTITIKSGKTKSTTVKSLKKKTTYYVKIRAYKTVNGKKLFGAYGKVKKIKTK